METNRKFMHLVGLAPVPNQPDEVGHNSEPVDNGPSIQEAANLIGIDAFSLYGLIQRGAIQPERASTGRLFLPRSQIEALLRGLSEDF
jgi:hypothetical protein